MERAGRSILVQQDFGLLFIALKWCLWRVSLVLKWDYGEFGLFCYFVPWLYAQINTNVNLRSFRKALIKSLNACEAYIPDKAVYVFPQRAVYDQLIAVFSQCLTSDKLAFSCIGTFVVCWPGLQILVSDLLRRAASNIAA